MKVLLCSYFKFPEDDAGAIRHEKLALMLKELGHDVFVVGLGKHCKFETLIYDGINYTSLRSSTSDFFGKVCSRVFFWPRLKRAIKKYRPDVVLMDDLGPFVTVFIKSFCRKNSINLIHDSIEWYSAEQYAFGVLSPFFLGKDILNRFLIDKSVKVISISTYLHNYYKNKGIVSVNIPIVLAQKDYCDEKTVDDVVSFMYAGQAGKKDSLAMILEAFSCLPIECFDKFRLHIVGCNKEQMLKLGISSEVLKKMEPVLVIHGRVPHEEVLQMFKTINYSLLMRNPDSRFAKAGFPTKVPECLAHSTPMITNISSDLDLYLEDMKNSLVVPEFSSESLRHVLEKAIAMPADKYFELSKSAYETACSKLNYGLFLKDLNKIIDE